MACESNPGSDQRGTVLQISTSSCYSTSQLYRVTNILEYHLHSGKAAQQLQLRKEIKCREGMKQSNHKNDFLVGYIFQVIIFKRKCQGKEILMKMLDRSCCIRRE
jgi:hypothetical protein